MDEQSEPAGQRLWKWAAATALALGTLLLLVAGLAGPAYRVGIAELPTAIDLVIWGARIGIPVMVLSLVATVLAMALTYLAGPALALGLPLHGNIAAAGLGALAFASMTVAYLPTLRYYDASFMWAAALPAVAVLYSAMSVDSACRHARGRGGAWKSRVYGP